LAVLDAIPEVFPVGHIELRRAILYFSQAREQVVPNAEVDAQVGQDLPVVVEEGPELGVAPTSPVAGKLGQVGPVDDVGVHACDLVIRIIQGQVHEIVEVVARPPHVEVAVLLVAAELHAGLHAVLALGDVDHIAVTEHVFREQLRIPAVGTEGVSAAVGVIIMGHAGIPGVDIVPVAVETESEFIHYRRREDVGFADRRLVSLDILRRVEGGSLRKGVNHAVARIPEIAAKQLVLAAAKLLIQPDGILVRTEIVREKEAHFPCNPAVAAIAPGGEPNVDPKYASTSACEASAVPQQAAR